VAKMPLSKEQIQAYLENPSIALKELASKYKEGLASADNSKSELINEMAGLRPALTGEVFTPEQLEQKKLQAAEIVNRGEDVGQSFGAINTKAASIAEQLANAKQSPWGRTIVKEAPKPKGYGNVIQGPITDTQAIGSVTVPDMLKQSTDYGSISKTSAEQIAKKMNKR
jgi:hypothetical protein